MASRAEAAWMKAARERQERREIGGAVRGQTCMRVRRRHATPPAPRPRACSSRPGGEGTCKPPNHVDVGHALLAAASPALQRALRVPRSRLAPRLFGTRPCTQSDSGGTPPHSNPHDGEGAAGSTRAGSANDPSVKSHGTARSAASTAQSGKSTTMHTLAAQSAGINVAQVAGVRASLVSRSPADPMHAAW